ncbi:MAG: HAMP domain-containing protein, partial [Actinomycetota bacterium]|nr:HAMP domain-containing protein [Actinomycetota bacterium]
MLVPLLALGAMAIVAVRGAVTDAQAIARDVGRDAAALDRLHARLAAAGRTATLAVSTRKRADALRFRAASARVDASFSELERAPDVDDRNRVRRTRRAWREARSLAHAAIDRRRARKRRADLPPPAFYDRLALAHDSVNVVRSVTFDQMRSELAPSHRVERALAVALLAVFAFGLIFATVVARRLAASVLRPLASVQAAARRLGDGDLATRVEPERDDDELGALAFAFNAMASRLQRS